MITKVGKITFDGEDIAIDGFDFEEITSYQEMIDDLLNHVTESLNNMRPIMPELNNVSAEDLRWDFKEENK